MIAMLGMYDMPPLQAANDRFWQAIRTHLGHGPEQLSRDLDFWDIWQSPDLLFAQTCGLPYRSRLHDLVGLIGTPDYGLPGCPAGYYRSVFVVHADSDGQSLADFTNGTLAYNEASSQSGWAGPIAHLMAARLRFPQYLATGSHAASALAVAEGRANIAGLDILTWQLLQDHDPVAARLRVIEQTEPTPGLPYIAARARDPGRIAQAVATAIDGLSAADQALLHIKALIHIEPKQYLAIPIPAGPDDIRAQSF